MSIVNNEILFPGKIAVITDAASVNKDSFHSVDHLLEKYGTGKIIHVTFPENFMAEQEQVVKIITSLATDREVKVIIINHAVVGSNAAVDKFKEIRDDLFIVYCESIEDPIAAAHRANLLLGTHDSGMSQAMVKQAKKQGAKTFVHYSFPRHLSISRGTLRRELVQETCVSEGILFVGATAVDPSGEAGSAGAQQFILEDVPRLVAKYGEDTAFFCSCCSLQTPLIKAVVENHAIFPQPCCPSPYHGFPEALGIETDAFPGDLNYVIAEASRIAAENNMADRLSTWPVSSSLMFANAGAEYAIKRLNGQAPKTGIDVEILEKCMAEYAKEAVGEGIDVTMTAYTEGGATYDNFKLILMGYLDF